MTEEIFGEELSKQLLPEYVSPLVAWLAHEDCPVSGEVFTVGAGRMARVFVGTGPGYFQQGGMTLEDVRDHWAEIDSVENPTIFRNVLAELKVISELLAEQ